MDRTRDDTPGEGTGGPRIDRGVDPLTPETTETPALAPAATVAGGIPAIVSALRHAVGETGVLRAGRLLRDLNQFHGYDCPGCAWPDPDLHRSVAEFCENGAKAIAEEATVRRVDPEFFSRWSVAELSRRNDYWLGKQGRLTHPMLLTPGSSHYQPIGWDEAFALVASELRALDSPDEAIFYTSGRTSNEAAFLYQLFVRELGTNNLPDCSNMCHESSGVALGETLGLGKGSVTLEDFDHTQLIVVIGQNPGTNHPRMLSALQRAVERGARIVSVNPLPEAGLIRFRHPQRPLDLLGKGTPLASLFLPVRINGDVPLLLGVAKMLLEMAESRPEIVARDFIAAHTEGFETWEAAVRAAPWDVLVTGSGISREQMRALAELMASNERIIVTWAMGLTQHRNAVHNIQEIVNLLLLRGSIGKPGAGTCPVRGHSNVQGDRTVGITERPSAAFLDRLREVVKFEPPRTHGLDTVASIRAMAEGRAKVFLALGGNFVSAAPDTALTGKALQSTRLTVHVSTKLNRSHLVAGRTGLILPALGRTEWDVQASGRQLVSVENSMGVVHQCQGSLPPVSGELRSEPAIVAGLARATLGERSKVDWEGLAGDYDRIRDLLEKVVPGFERYNQRVREPGGFHLPNGPRQGRFTTPGGKARFTVHPVPAEPLGPGQLMMMTIRSHDQFNTTIYGLEDRYRGIGRERRVVLMNADDLRERGLSAGQLVDLTSHFQGEARVARRFVVVEYPIPPRCCATYFPEANVLVPLGAVAEKSNTPASKSVVVTVAASEGSVPQHPDLHGEAPAQS
ncbi:MAG TPA: FdhF/YdeP family oxidoreductase [Myxococcaceae bacterium]